MKNIMYCLLVFLSIFGCKKNIKNDLIEKVDNQCGNSPNAQCIVSLKDVTKFNWDRMYIFPDWTTSDTISKIIGFKYSGNDVDDQYYRWLFVKGKVVVHEEDNENLDYSNSSIEFLGTNLSGNDNAFILKNSQATFTVIKGKLDSTCSKCFVYSFSTTNKRN